jgi:hypothetical protein
MWKTNRERNPERILRNADDLFVPAHRVEFVKRLPIIALPTAWNSAPGNKSKFNILFPIFYILSTIKYAFIIIYLQA